MDEFNDEFMPSEKHIFTQRRLATIDIDVIYTSMVASNESIFVFGGDNSGVFVPSAEVRRYDISDQKWHNMTEMPHYLWGATAQIVGDEIFIMGGGRAATYEAYNLAYNITGNSWVKKKNLPFPRKGLASGVIDGIIYITGGYHMWGAYDIKSHCHAYNPKTNTWKNCKDPVYSRSYAMSIVVDNYLYVLGGYEKDHKRGGYMKMERYCPETNRWEAMPDMPRPRPNAVAVAIDSKIFILCGNGEEDDVTMDYYDTRTREWTISEIPTPQLISPGVAMIDNKIYLTGGMTHRNQYNRNLYEITYSGMKE